jgi:phage terminase large subunit-like protein
MTKSPQCLNVSTTELSNWLRNTQKGWARKNLTDDQGLLVRDEWMLQGRYQQLLFGGRPRTFLVVGGRGAGKTRTGAEWVNALVRGFAPFSQRQKHMHIALVGETLGDVREVMIEGPAGIRTMARGDRPRFEAGRRRLLWANGAVAYMFSSEDPESLRGPQFGAAWCDEAAKWKNAEATFDMLQFGLRLGETPRQIVTTTPKPTPLMRRLMGDPRTTVHSMRTDENAAHLAASFLSHVHDRYGGTRLGRQELDGELIEDRDDALWSRALIERCYVGGTPTMRRIVVAVDPPASSHRSSDACGIVAAGLDEDGRVVVLADDSLAAAKPLDWANRAIGLFHRLRADCLVAEVNQGGEMVTTVMRGVDATVPVKPVRARRGKWLRAEPVAAFYQQGRVLHAGRFPQLEDEMCDFGPNGLSENRSPDRLDALVWAVTELMPDWGAEPKIRQIG